MAMKKRSSLKSSTQTQTEKKNFPWILNYTTAAAASCILHLQLSPEDRSWLDELQESSLCFLNSIISILLKGRKNLFLLNRNASKQPILAVDFICNFSTQRQVRDLSASTFCWVSSIFRLRIYVLMHLDSVPVTREACQLNVRAKYFMEENK